MRCCACGGLHTHNTTHYYTHTHIGGESVCEDREGLSLPGKIAQQRSKIQKPSLLPSGTHKMATENAKHEAQTAARMLIFVSAQLTTLAVPNRPCWGEWLQMPNLSPHWHRQLSDTAFLYLRHAVFAAIKAGSLDPESAAVAEARLVHIQRLGRSTGQLTPSVENPFAEPLAGWQWATGMPVLLD